MYWQQRVGAALKDGFLAERALNRRIGRFSHPALCIIVFSNRCIVADGFERGTAIVNHRLNAEGVELAFIFS